MSSEYYTYLQALKDGMMEGVEDIPESVLSEGLSFDWESFGDYMNVLASTPRNMDIGAQVPHAALRFSVMGERGADHTEVPTEAEIVTPRDQIIKMYETGRGSIKMRADELSVIGSEEKGSEVMIAKGQPATFYQMLDSGKPIEAEANEVRYDLKTQTLTLSNNAQLKQEESLVKGSMIKYSIDKQEMVAQGDENSRVTTIFLPQQLNEIAPQEQQ